MKLHKILLLSLCAYALISCGGAEERKAVYKEKAKSSIDAGDLDKARIELKNVLQIDPKDGMALHQLGYVFEIQKNYRKAYSNYLKSEELSPELLVNHARLGRLYLVLMNEPAKAQEKVDLILEKDANNADALLLKAAILLREKKHDQPLVIIRDVAHNNPNHVEGIALLASLYLGDKNINEAITVLDNGLKDNPNDMKLTNLLITVLMVNKDFERAEIIHKHYLEKNPDNIFSYNGLAKFYDQTGDKVKAEEVLRASVENDSDDEKRILILIKYIYESKGSDAAISELSAFIAINDKFGKLRTGLAELHLLNNDVQSAINAYEQVVIDFSEEPEGLTSRLALATIYISEKKFDRANVTINDAMGIFPNDSNVNYLKAKLAIHDKDFETAIIALRIVTKETPENIDAFLSLASIYEVLEKKALVIDTINSAYENNRTNATSLLKLAKYHIIRDVDRAEKVIDDYNNIKENDYEGLSLKAEFYNKKKSQTEAYDIAQIIRKLYPNKPNGYLQAIPFYSLKNDTGKAISMLEEGYLNTVDNRTILILLTALQASEKQYDIASNRIVAKLKATPDDAELKLLLAKIYLVDDKNDKGIQLITEVIADKPNVEEPYLILSKAYLMKKDNAAAKEVLIKGNNNVEQSIKIPLRLAGFYESDGDHMDAIATYREINNKAPDNLLVINNLASMLSDYGNDEEDLNEAKVLVAKLEVTNEPVFHDTIGWVYYRLGDNQKAVDFLSKAVEANSEFNIFNYHLGMAHKMAGDKVKAKVYLEKSLSGKGKKVFKQKDLAEAALKEL